MVARPTTGTIPESPGSYQFRDTDGRIIYVGKAKSLRNRLNNYFVDPQLLAPRTRQMVETAASVEWIQVDTDVDALMLEYELIQKHQPRFNVRYRDDKSYPWLAITMDHEWPRPMVTRGKKRKGVRYYGPFGHAYAIRETLDLLLRTFPVRTCSDNKLETHAKLGRPCLLFHIEKCSGPCVGEISKPEYDVLVEELSAFLDGDSDEIVARIEGRMAEAASNLEFELAARLRDQMTSVRKAIEKQQIVGARNENYDVVGIASDELESAVQVFHVRKGRVVGRRGLIIDKPQPLTDEELSGHAIEAIYGKSQAEEVPSLVLVPSLPDDDIYERWLEAVRTSTVEVRVPQRGAKRELHQTVTRNAQEEFARHRLKRATDHNSRARALNELQEYLELPTSPLRIECYDMSHIQGTDYVGSMVVVEDGLPAKTQYRRFKVKDVPGNDDFAAMEEVLTRRLEAYLAEKKKPVDERSGRFSYPPQLIVVDGGKGQLGVAERVLDNLGLTGEISLASLAKRFEEVYVPGRSEPLQVPRGSEALYMLQRLRDEAHRFAITFHRERRGKRMTTSTLDEVPGLGPTRRKRLVKELGSVKAVKQASLEDLLGLSWLPEAVARAVYERFASSA